MLPVGVSIRRLATRALRTQRITVSSSASIALRSHARVLSNANVCNRSAFFSSMSPSSNIAASVIDNDETEFDEVILEPIEDEAPLTSGFADQKLLSEFELSQTTVRNLEKVGITHLFPVQAQSFAVMMEGADIVGRSKTGSGKTLAFALPIVEKILASGKQSREPKAVILLPTRELALQVTEEIKRISPQLRTANIVGGVSYTVQENQLRRGVDILVGTPGRIMDLVNKGSLNLEEVEVSVLDEADMMLKFGFQEAVETILGWIPKESQCVMWSATFPKWVNTMARKFLKNPVSIDLVGNDDTHVPATVSHKAIHAPMRTRIDLLENVLRHHAKGGQALVFTETKQEADEIANVLGGQNARALHGDLSQGMRTSTMEGFRNGSVKTLICTDIAARGLDIANVELVIQYRLPSDKESFVHRAGRTGRAGRSGTNVVFFDRFDVNDVFDFEKRYKFKFNHASPPQVEHVLESAVSDASKKLAEIPAHSARMFEDAAQQMLDQQGVSALSSALAIICGFDTKRLNAVSMITGKQRMQTVQVEGLKSARDVTRILSASTIEFNPRDIHAVDDKFVFDVPHESMDQRVNDFV
uniref:RNA helicase n=1 Tax=Globisporangium ultimum (strain ATCC 200006 / CBS 805.95 / DAOM BR144) TaxID=431595 RepID=K3X5Q3_GLOUD